MAKVRTNKVLTYILCVGSTDVIPCILANKIKGKIFIKIKWILFSWFLHTVHLSSRPNTGGMSAHSS